MDLADAAALIGRWSWRQGRAFQTIGGWVLSEPDPEAKIQLFSHSRRKGRHALSLAAMLPSIAGGRGADFLVPEEADREAMARLEEADREADADPTASRLSALYRELLPAELEGYRAFLGRSTPLNAMPLVRAVAAVLADEEQDLRLGEGLLARFL